MEHPHLACSYEKGNQGMKDGDLRLMKSSHGKWQVEQWCYHSSGDEMRWGRPTGFSNERKAREYLNKELKREAKNRADREATWTEIK